MPNSPLVDFSTSIPARLAVGFIQKETVKLLRTCSAAELGTTMLLLAPAKSA